MNHTYQELPTHAVDLILVPLAILQSTTKPLTTRIYLHIIGAHHVPAHNPRIQENRDAAVVSTNQGTADVPAMSHLMEWIDGRKGWVCKLSMCHGRHAVWSVSATSGMNSGFCREKKMDGPQG